MRKLVWLSDIHLEFCEPAVIDCFLVKINAANADAVLLGGDIGTASSLAGYLRSLHQAIELPIYFVLGNHDYYGGRIDQVHAKVTQLCAETPRIRWLAQLGIEKLDDETCLIGHGGWADGRAGDYKASRVMLNDYRMIAELSQLDRADRLAEMQRLAQCAADHFARQLPNALRSFRRVVVLMHVPPFEEATWHQGRTSGSDWLPHFCCKIAGDVLSGQMAQHPDQEMLVLCGHTHSSGVANILPNLRVLTAEAQYGRPQIQQVLDTGSAIQARTD